MVEVTNPTDPEFDVVAKLSSSRTRLSYPEIARAYNDAEVFAILTLQKGRTVTQAGNVRRYLENWGLQRGHDFTVRVVSCDEGPLGSVTIKRLVLEKLTPKQMVSPRRK